jgi:hypothetical protein
MKASTTHEVFFHDFFPAVQHLVIVLICAGWVAGAQAQPSTLLFHEGFENGWNGWTNDTTYNIDKRYAWLVMSPTNGPMAAHSGTNCAGTVNPGIDCYLVSPLLILPVVNQYSNHLWLFYWQWQKYIATASNSCLSDVKIRQMIPDPMGGYYWGPWNIIDPGTSGVIPMDSPAWRRRGIDLTLFSGWPVQLGFGHSGTGNPGWFVDDVEIWDVPVRTNWPGLENFESGWGDWHTDNGAWDIGTPTGSGPTNTPSGTNCAGTGLDGLVPSVWDAILWSPPFYLPPINLGERVYLQFEQWHDYPSPFCIAVNWSQWWSGIGWTWPQTLYSDPLFVVTHRTWTTMTIDITSLAGLPLPARLGFSHLNVSGGGLGWFIDNVRVNVARLQIIKIERNGNDIRLTWTCPAGNTNLVQCSPTVSAGFTNLSGQLIATGAGEVTNSYTHAGGAANATARFYRIRRLP